MSFVKTIPSLQETEFSRLEERLCFAKHAHPTYSIGIMPLGLSLCQGEGETYFMGRHKVCVYHPGEEHTCVFEHTGGSWAYWNCYPKEEMLREYASEILGERGEPRFAKTVVEDPHAYRLFWELFDLVGKERELLALQEASLKAFSYLIAHHASPWHPSSRFLLMERAKITQAKERILEGDEVEKITLEELASLCGMSRFRFLRLFAKLEGMTPHRFLLMHKTQKAKRYLQEGCDISEAALLSGFCDQAHLSRTLRRFYGYTPRSLRS